MAKIHLTASKNGELTKGKETPKRKKHGHPRLKTSVKPVEAPRESRCLGGRQRIREMIEKETVKGGCVHFRRVDRRGKNPTKTKTEKKARRGFRGSFVFSKGRESVYERGN